MKKSTRGALAAGAAALLLFGGMGTRATWNDDDSVTGTAITSGYLRLVNPVCDGWEIDGSLFNPASIKIVPGKVLTQVCTFEVDAAGINLTARLSVTAPGFSNSNGLATELDATASYTRGSDVVNGTTVLNDGDVITATIEVELPSDATNLSQDLTTTLNSITVTATQA